VEHLISIATKPLAVALLFVTAVPVLRMYSSLHFPFYCYKSAHNCQQKPPYTFAGNSGFLHRTVLWGVFVHPVRTKSTRPTLLPDRRRLPPLHQRSVTWCDRNVARPLLFPLLSWEIKVWRDKYRVAVSSSDDIQMFHLWNARRTSADFTCPLGGMLTAILIRQRFVLPWRMETKC
jgi:hypothetical protein